MNKFSLKKTNKRETERITNLKLERIIYKENSSEIFLKKMFNVQICFVLEFRFHSDHGKMNLQIQATIFI